MKNRRIENAITSTLVAALVLVGGLAHAATLNWTGTSTTTPPVWSDTNNWDIHALPAVGDTVMFLAAGATNAPGLVNNTVSVNTSINILDAAAKISVVTGVSNYDTTLIKPGITLNTTNINVGFLGDTLSEDPSYIYTVVGPSAILNMGNTNSPGVAGGLRVSSQGRQPVTNPPQHFGLLDLSGVDTFTVGMANFWVGWLDVTATLQNDRPAGAVLLGKTNIIVLSGNVADTATAIAPFRIFDSSVCNTPIKASYVEMGQVNAIYTSLMKVGGARSMANDGPARMYFRSGLVNPTLKLRGANDATRLGTLAIGDNLEHQTAGNNLCGGVLDLTGGTVDALIDNLVVARSATATGAGSAIATSSGTLSWTAGTFDVNNLFVGLQFADRLNTATGIVNVASSAVLRVNNVTIGRDAGSQAGTGIGTINIDGGTVVVTNSFAENNLAGGNGSSTVNITNNGVLNLQPAGVPNPVTAVFDTLNFSSGTLTNGTLGITTLNLLSPATAFLVGPGMTLSPAGPGTVGTLTVNGDLTMNGGAVAMDLGGTPDNINVTGALNLSGLNSVSINVIGGVGPGTYPLFTYGGSLSGDLSNLQLTGTGIFADTRYTVGLDSMAPNINFTVNGSAANLTWSGGNNGNAWDLKNTANWNNGSQQFFQFDLVTFDDSGNASTPVLLSGALFPLGVTFAASSKHYTLAGSGKITGTVGVNVSGAAKVTLLTTNNDYTGGTTISGGILEVGDGATADGTLAGAVTNNTELDVNPVFSNNVPAVIVGAGTLIKNGPGLTRLSAANNLFTGPVTVNQGTLQAGTTTALGTGTGQSGIFVTVNSGATLDIGGNTTVNSLIIQGPGVGGNGALIDSGPTAAFTRDIQLAADTTFGGNSGWTVQPASATSGEPGLTAFQFKITKVGTNNVFVNGLNNLLPWNLDLGKVDVKEGQFSLGGFLNLGTDTADPITVFTNATLGFRTINTNNNPLVKTFVFNDGSDAFATAGGLPMVDGSVTLNGTVVFDMDSTNVLRVNCPVTGGTLVKGIGFHPGTASTGAGTLVLFGANTLSGFKVQTGTVALTNSATVSAPQLQLAGGILSVVGRTDKTLTLASGQSLIGNGTVLGIVSSPSGTSVTPLATNGIITVSSNLTLRGTTTLDLNRSATGVVTNSQIIVTNTSTLDLGGALVLTSSGQPLQVGDAFKLFKAATILNPFTDASITYPTLNVGLSWTNRIAIDGSVAVVSQEPTTPPTLSFSSAGSLLSITWPSSYTSYTLQIQTNAPGVGITTNWATVSTTNNQINLPIDPTDGSVFLRLHKP